MQNIGILEHAFEDIQTLVGVVVAYSAIIPGGYNACSLRIPADAVDAASKLTERVRFLQASEHADTGIGPEPAPPPVRAVRAVAADGRACKHAALHPT